MNFLKIGVRVRPMVLWCHGRGCTGSQTPSHIHIIHIQSILAHSFAVDGPMGAPLHSVTVTPVQVGVDFLNNWGMTESE